MATQTTKAPRKAKPPKTIPELAHDHSMAVLSSTATADILEEDGKRTDRLIYLGHEYATKFAKFYGLQA
jgi:hypothetical protein